MLRLILSGCCGKMGRYVRDVAARCDDIEIVAGVDIAENAETDFPVFESFEYIGFSADAVVDFSSPSALPCLLRYIERTRTPAVIATTGLSESEIEDISHASHSAAIFFSSNMSLGINAVYNAVKMLSGALFCGFDVDIIETHHKEKKDMPSATALLLSDAVNIGRNKPTENVQFESAAAKARDKSDVIIHSLRAGNSVGEHSVIFSGEDEVIEVRHTSRSRRVFAEGALDAARFIATKKSGLYTMKDLLLTKKRII